MDSFKLDTAQSREHLAVTRRLASKGAERMTAAATVATHFLRGEEPRKALGEAGGPPERSEVEKSRAVGAASGWRGRCGGRRLRSGFRVQGVESGSKAGMMWSGVGYPWPPNMNANLEHVLLIPICRPPYTLFIRNHSTHEIRHSEALPLASRIVVTVLQERPGAAAEGRGGASGAKDEHRLEYAAEWERSTNKVAVDVSVI
ncbi:hypothetical protein R3P38DRAFT_3380264 [Favolaschia claudopus]|uniref:Uncharacterized protein n=1 Tax=Favolaschia claudopus TaxID=2862362 RepID=A0AAV9Z2G3_9AGAR